MKPRGFSPLERRILLALISLIRDREPDRDEWLMTEIRLRTLHDALYVPGERSYDLERRNQRQAQRRALARLHEQQLVWVFALAWVNIADREIIEWQGGGSRRRRPGCPYREGAPRWRLVGLNDAGIKAGELLELQAAGDGD